MIFNPDLILLDVAMPETDGGEVAARIQSDPTLHRTPIVFLTALVTKTETRSGLRIQGHPFLAKPISFSDLIKGIEENFRFRIYDFNAGPLWRTRRAALNAALRGEIHRKNSQANVHPPGVRLSPPPIKRCHCRPGRATAPVASVSFSNRRKASTLTFFTLLVPVVSAVPSSLTSTQRPPRWLPVVGGTQT